MALPCTSSSSSALFFPSPTPSLPPQKQQPHLLLLLRSPAFGRRRLRIPASTPRRPPNFPPEAVVVVSDPRAWREIRAFNEVEYGSDEDDDDDRDEEEEDDRSLDLLVRFLHNVFRKVSRRVRKAVKSVLPVPISTKLVGFSVDGVLILAFLWILKAFLEVVCTLGSMIFVSILLIRGVWSGVSYLQEIRYDRGGFNNDGSAWSGVQAAT